MKLLRLSPSTRASGRRSSPRYREPSNGRSVTEIAITAFPLIALWFSMWASLISWATGSALLLAIPAAGFLVRLFMIQHDCSHGSFFGRRKANDWVGRVIGVFTLTPHDLWRAATRSITPVRAISITAASATSPP